MNAPPSTREERRYVDGIRGVRRPNQQAVPRLRWVAGVLSIRFGGQPYLGLGAGVFCAFSPAIIANIANNLFGWDRGGLRVVLAANPPRQMVLFGKNLGLLPIAACLGVVALVIVQFFNPQTAADFPASILQVASFCLLFSLIGNHFSITAPLRGQAEMLAREEERILERINTTVD